MAPNKLPQSLLLLLLLMLFRVTPSSSSRSESEALLDFKDGLQNTGALLNWTASTSPCSGPKANWAGLLCDESGRVWGLQLENMGLSGSIDVDILNELPSLRTLSFMNNNFNGNFPSLNKLAALKSVYLSNNKFSGEILGDAFDGMRSLKKVYLANNKFDGHISLSLTILPKLIELSLEGNQFNGQIPEFHSGKLKLFNISNNNLQGKIPASLSKMNASSFSEGNKDLCSAPLQPCSSSSSKLPTTTIVIVVVAVVLALAAIVAVFIILRRGCKSPQASEADPPPHHRKKAVSGDLEKVEQGNFPENSTNNKKNNKKGENNSGKLTFMRKDREEFELSDLLRASAEVLGSGYFGSSYKAAMMSGEVVVVKRFRQMNNFGREEFQEHMTRIGSLKHPNLLPLVAFYFRKEEKLLVTDYVDNVNLAVYLHGNLRHQTLDWPTRLKIIKGVGKALEHLYKELSGQIVAHGHLKSSNVLLRRSFEPLLTDYGLVPFVNQEHAQQILVAYKSPEYKHNGRVTKKTDVWSFGILILEVLTGKFPANYLQQGKGSDTDLVTLVNSILREGRMDELFDKDMGGTKNGEGEMVKLLKIGLACAENDVQKRCDLKEAVERIEEVKDKDIDHEEFYSSYTSEGDVRSSRGLSDDFKFSI